LLDYLGAVDAHLRQRDHFINLDFLQQYLLCEYVFFILQPIHQVGILLLLNFPQVKFFNALEVLFLSGFVISIDNFAARHLYFQPIDIHVFRATPFAVDA